MHGVSYKSRGREAGKHSAAAAVSGLSSRLTQRHGPTGTYRPGLPSILREERTPRSKVRLQRISVLQVSYRVFCIQKDSMAKPFFETQIFSRNVQRLQPRLSRKKTMFILFFNLGTFHYFSTQANVVSVVAAALCGCSCIMWSVGAADGFGVRGWRGAVRSLAAPGGAGGATVQLPASIQGLRWRRKQAFFQLRSTPLVIWRPQRRRRRRRLRRPVGE